MDQLFRTLQVAVVAIDGAGVVGDRVASPMWGPLVQCETLLKHNGISVVVGAAEYDAEIVLATDLSARKRRANQLDVVYDPDWKQPLLIDGRAAGMRLGGAEHRPRAGPVVNAIKDFLERLSRNGDVMSNPALSIEVEITVGLANRLLYTLEHLLAQNRALRDENAQLTLLIGELRAEAALLQTQISQPHRAKVHWTASSLMLTLISIAALIQGSDALLEMAGRASSAGSSPVTVQVVEVNQRCEVVIDLTAPSPSGRAGSPPG